MSTEKLQLAIVGFGPRGLSVAERLCANAESLLPEGRELVIHLVDPYVFEGGQVWRSTQDQSLLMNTVACQVTMFVDDTVDCAGPVVGGPSLYEWARSIALIGTPNDRSGHSRRSRHARSRRLPVSGVLRELPAVGTRPDHLDRATGGQLHVVPGDRRRRT